MSFESQIQRWVQIDNKMKELNEQLRLLRDEKADLCQNITEYASQNNLKNATIKIGDGSLKFADTRVATPLSFKHLEKSLGEIIKNETQVSQIVEYVKQAREIKVVSEIKRFDKK